MDTDEEPVSSSKCRKRKYDLHAIIQKHEDFLTKTIRMHEEKIERIDKFLKLMKQSVHARRAHFKLNFERSWKIEPTESKKSKLLMYGVT